MRASARHITGWLTVTACSFATHARNSATVASAPVATRTRKASCKGASRGGTQLRCAPGAVCPVRLSRAHTSDT